MVVPQKKHIRASTACYGNIFIFLYVDDVRTSHKTHICVSTACYKDRVTLLYVDDVHIPQETDLWAFSSVTGIALLLYM
jgi:hypothetical protein